MQQRFLVGAILTVVAVTAGFTLSKSIITKYIFADEAPKQPINFSHKIHAGDNNIPCRFCHIYAWRSKVSGVPPVQKCIGCHKVEKVDSPEIKKLQAYWVSKKPIRWIKVYDIPDYIYFPHKRHVKAGVRCQTCHGEVQKMAVVRRVADLHMGWCLNCHRNRTFRSSLDNKLRSGPKWDCWDCHV